MTSALPRLLFAKSPSGTRLVRGEIIKRLQRPLHDNALLKSGVDGILGSDTKVALAMFQQQRGLPVSGGVCTATWEALCGLPAPSAKERALQLTADFEGHGFGTAAGDFDDAWLTWGIIGFTLKHGEVQAIMNSLRQSNPGLIEKAFGPLSERLFAVLDGTEKDQCNWARSISIGRKRYHIEAEWAEAFQRLGQEPECQATQLSRVEKYWRIAERDASTYALNSERGLALCFDIAVQNGGIEKTEHEDIRWLCSQRPPQSENDLLTIIADAVAEGSRPQYVEDVRSRKRTLATGSGMVHGVRYDVGCWGIGEAPIT